MAKPKQESPEALELSSDLDELHFSDFQDLELTMLRDKCSLLAVTHHADYFIGVTFQNRGALDLEVSVVRQIDHGFNHPPGRVREQLNTVACQWAVLQDYVTVGMAAARFMQNEIDWGTFKLSLTELLVGGVIK